MPVEWRLATRGTFQAHIARMAGFSLVVFGTDGAWFWLVSREEDSAALAEGEERTLTAAKVIAEDAARGLLDEGDPKPGGE